MKYQGLIITYTRQNLQDHGISSVIICIYDGMANVKVIARYIENVSMDTKESGTVNARSGTGFDCCYSGPIRFMRGNRQVFFD